jgi:hypothetical protein
LVLFTRSVHPDKTEQGEGRGVMPAWDRANAERTKSTYGGDFLSSHVCSVCFIINRSLHFKTSS